MFNAQGDHSLQNVSTHLGLDFRNHSFLIRALTHRSYFNEHPEVVEDNERLEFLGDAVLDFVVASWLYHRFPEMAEGGGRDRSALLGSAFEAIIGALYLDQGINAAKIFIEKFLENTINEIIEDRKDLDPKSQLQEWSQSQGHGAPVYTTVEEIGPDHAKIFVIEVSINGQVYSRGKGNSKQIAAKEAARQTLKELGLL